MSSSSPSCRVAVDDDDDDDVGGVEVAAVGDKKSFLLFFPRESKRPISCLISFSPVRAMFTFSSLMVLDFCCCCCC